MQGKANYVFWDIFTRSDSRCGITMTDCKTHENWLKLTALHKQDVNLQTMLLERIIDKTWYTMEGVHDIYTLRCFVGTIEVERRFIYV